ncbi:hypothetical protein SANT12839_005230 [Streptomyces antimycoticus]|uniref:Endonuclease/exonuclease/phosphatase domain-containing protein n=1 Tax=Streptomyces antimycoticus TaxID=68175 RepID=A0A4D4JSD6_9ACTN|nr:hypothetical protein SANT12839_005230 [Streptomyces antimycoticus]
MVEQVDGGAASPVQAAAPRRVGRWVARWARGGSPWTRGRVLAGLAVLTAGLLAFHRVVPNSVGHLGSLLEAFLPWLGLVVVVLLGPALLRRSAIALVALLLPVAAWAYLFGGLLLPGTKPGPHDLVVVQHNVSDENTDPAGTARTLADAGPDLIALEELVPTALPVYEKTLAPDYPYHAVRAPSDCGRGIRSPTPGRWTSNPGDHGGVEPRAADRGPHAAGRDRGVRRASAVGPRRAEWPRVLLA